MFIDHHFINFIIYMLKGGSYIMKKVKIFIQKRWKSIVVGGGIFLFLVCMLCSSVSHEVLGRFLMNQHLKGIQGAQGYKVIEVSTDYASKDIEGKTFYTMELCKDGEDEHFTISWTTFEKVEDSFSNIENEDNMVMRFIDEFQKEMEILTQNLLPKEHHVVIGELNTKETSAYLKLKYNNNDEYEIESFKDIPLTFGLHVDVSTSLAQAVQEAKMLQKYFDKKGLQIEVYNITIDGKDGKTKTYSNLERKDLDDNLVFRLESLDKGNKDKSIVLEIF